MLDVLLSVNPVWFAVSFAAQTAAYIAYAFALQGIARVDGGPRLPFRQAIRVVAAGFGAYFARSMKGGFELDYRALRGAGARRQEAMARVVGLGLLEYAVLAPAALGAAMWIYTAPDGGNRYAALTLPWLAVVPGFGIALWLTNEGRRRRLQAGRGEGGRHRAVADAVGGLTILRQLLFAPHRHIRPLLGTTLYWFCELVCLWASLRAFHAEVAIPALVLAYATGYVISRRGLPLGASASRRHSSPSRCSGSGCRWRRHCSAYSPTARSTSGWRCCRRPCSARPCATSARAAPPARTTSSRRSGTRRSRQAGHGPAGGARQPQTSTSRGGGSRSRRRYASAAAPALTGISVSSRSTRRGGDGGGDIGKVMSGTAALRGTIAAPVGV